MVRVLKMLEPWIDDDLAGWKDGRLAWEGGVQWIALDTTSLIPAGDRAVMINTSSLLLILRLLNQLQRLPHVLYQASRVALHDSEP